MLGWCNAPVALSAWASHPLREKGSLSGDAMVVRIGEAGDFPHSREGSLSGQQDPDQEIQRLLAKQLRSASRWSWVEQFFMGVEAIILIVTMLIMLAICACAGWVTWQLI